MPRVSVAGSQTTGGGQTPAEPVTGSQPAPSDSAPLVAGRHPNFPNEPSTDEELREVKDFWSTGAFEAFPALIHFSGEMPEETIIILVRAHLITLVPWILLVLVLAILPLILLPFLSGVGFLAGVTPGLITILVIVWYLGLFTYSYLKILFWYFNVGLVTNERVVDVDWNSLTDRDVDMCQINEIQDVRAVQTGVLEGVFDYGDIYVQTAAEQENIEFLNVPHPQLVVRKVQELKQAEEGEHEINPEPSG